ncbi:MbcA/ParS/Xre antitoxin family protein [Phenylobacterium sp. 58.2.17]|uniref:MbcA/ParS/Xre antitoxin family protein n=1 Tax=Phenylobacterium sp. 58.2.17 TaxID=2969306 RepID=UPI0022644CCF|nr:MbcA/ParS/Xre antitoxin family protein [Phenylobacterium sp. 58.2.17]MCX7584895.1 MbcA/ParS/Xre antitoxin family protein [Phenylobacterium sp. 58.2.17]
MVQLVQISDRTAGVTPASPAITDAEGLAMARAAVRLFGLWELTDAEACILLGELSPRTYARWKAGDIGRIGRDLKARLSNLMGIHKALRIIFTEPARAYGWVRRPNQAFSGRSALDVMLQGELLDLVRVRRYLDAERGGW